MQITKAQLAKVQTLFAQLASRDLSLENTRESRLAWASGLCRRPITSFSSLTADEAGRLIDTAQGQLGLECKQPRRTPEQARRRGLDGRRDGQEFAGQPQMVSGAELEEIASYAARLGMDRARLDAFLASGSSPLGRRSKPEIRTTAEAGKVRFALIGMLRKAGLWEDRRSA
jgi:hypothetical protein